MAAPPPSTRPEPLPTSEGTAPKRWPIDLARTDPGNPTDPVAAHPVGAVAETAYRPAREQPALVAGPATNHRRLPLTAILLSVLLVAGLGTGAALWQRGQHRTAAESTATAGGHRSAQATASSSIPRHKPVARHRRPREHRHVQPAPAPVIVPGNPVPVRPRAPAPAPQPRPSTSAVHSRPTPQPAPPPATAAVCTPNGCAARAYFVATGEHLFVCDQETDGYGGAAFYTRTDVPGQNNLATDTNGSGTCIDHNMNMPDGAKITFKVCLVDADNRFSDCSEPITATA